MHDEGQHFDRKSLRLVQGASSDFDSLARDCVCFANSAGGQLLIGIEDDQSAPPTEQRIVTGLLDKIRRRVSELTVNVQVLTELARDANGGEYIVLTVPRSVGVASTSDGRYYLRVDDTCRPVVGDDVLRLANERPTLPWEGMTAHQVPRARVDEGKLERWERAIRGSDRVKSSVKEKTTAELIDHYGMATGGELTNLGVLIVGTTLDRQRLGTAPVVQVIRYDERGTKIGKHVWDDYALSPPELIDAIWDEVPDFRESYELPDGMFRASVPAFDEVVIRELLVNALVHRPYTQRGDIFLNLHPDRIEIANPGRLPLGVTPRNILHASRRRNDGLARIFHDLRLMEREGSGFDLVYERLLATGRVAPTLREGTDSVHVIAPKRIVHVEVLRLLSMADQRYQLTQRERIALALLAGSEGMLAGELVTRLELEETSSLRPWIERLIELELVEHHGRTNATRYFVPPALLKAAGLDQRTTLARMPPHRLRALVIEDLIRFPHSALSEIHRRIGAEIPLASLKRALQELVETRRVEPVGERRWRRYRAAIDPDPGGNR